MNKAKPLYYAVIFTSKLKDRTVGYEETAQEMFDLAKSQPGFLGFKSVRQELGITISYWKSIENILMWKNTPNIKSLRIKELTNGMLLMMLKSV